MSAADSASLNVLSLLYTIGAWLVVLGVILEGIEILTRRSAKRKLRRFIGPLQQPNPEPHTPDWAHTVGDVGFAILVGALVLEQVCHQKMEHITERERNRLTNVLDLTTRQTAELNLRSSSNEVALIQLSHLYDVSTNALAEANSRLRAAKIKTAKEVLFDCLNAIDPKMLKDLAFATAPIRYTGQAEFFRFSELMKAAKDPSVSKYIFLEGTGGGLLLENGVVAGRVSIRLDPALLK